MTKWTGGTWLRITKWPFAAAVLWTAVHDVRDQWPCPPSPGWQLCLGSSGQPFSSRPPPSLTSRTVRCWSSSPCWPPREPRPAWKECPRWRPVCGRSVWQTYYAPQICGEAAPCWRSRRRRLRRWGAWQNAARTARSRRRAVGGPERTREQRGSSRRKSPRGTVCVGARSTVWCHSPRAWLLPAPASWTDWSMQCNRIMINFRP